MDNPNNPVVIFSLLAACPVECVRVILWVFNVFFFNNISDKSH